MKINIIRSILIVSFIFCFFSVLTAQHQERNNYKRGVKREYKSHQHKHSHKEHKKHPRNRHYRKYDRKHNHAQHRAIPIQSCRRSNVPQSCSQPNFIHHHRPNHHRYGKHYLQRLPSRHYLSFNVGYDTYYHSDGHFYSYLPGKGYWRVQLRLPSVNRLPYRCSYRNVNGINYHYSEGYFYIPHQHGYYRIYNSQQQLLSRACNW